MKTLFFSILATFQFELEAVPLKIWFIPEEFITDVVQVLSFIRDTKEYVLLGLMAHGNNSSEALDYFETQLMHLVVANVGIMSSDAALQCLQDLKQKCTYTSGSGLKAPKGCWQVEEKFQKFYEKHPW